jgi:hypothetical protein
VDAMYCKDTSYRNCEDINGLNDEIRTIIQVLLKFDLESEIELIKIADSALANEVKQARKLAIMFEHQERRRPYADLLNERWEKLGRRSMAA